MKKTLIYFFLLLIAIFQGYSQEVKIFNKSNSNIVDDNLLSVAVDKKGNKWIGTSKHGLVLFDGENYTNFNKDNSVIKGDYISPIFVDSKGNVWVSFSQPKDGIAKYDGSNWKVYSEEDLKTENISVISICEDKNGTLYFGGVNGIFILQNETWTTLKMPSKDIVVRAIDISKNGVIAIGHNNGLLIYENGKWQTFTEKKSELSLAVVRAVKFKENNDLLVGYGGGFGNGGFSVLSDKKWVHYNKSNSKIPDHKVRDMEFDGSNYWMATNNGVIQFNENELKPLLFRDGMFMNVILDIAIENETIWIASNFGLIRYIP